MYISSCRVVDYLIQIEYANTNLGYEYLQEVILTISMSQTHILSGYWLEGLYVFGSINQCIKKSKKTSSLKVAKVLV